MKSLGLNFAQNDLRFVALAKDAEAITMIAKDKIVYPNLEIPNLMEWFETQLDLLITKYQPGKIGYKVSMSLDSIKQIQQSCYPQGLLNLLAKRRNIPIASWTPQGINATKFGETKSTDVYGYVDTKFGTNPPYWDKQTKDALLTAWFSLL